jgi:hypothetical protein
VVDDDVAPYAFVHLRGRARINEDFNELLRFAIEIGGRYMGPERAEEFGRRNAIPGELLVRVTPGTHHRRDGRSRLLTLPSSVSRCAGLRTH